MIDLFTRFRKSKNRYLWLVFLTFIIWALLNLIWAYQTQAIPHTDMARHLWNSLVYDQNIRLVSLKQAIITWLDEYRYYPPFMYLITLPFYSIFGYSIFSALASNILWLAILIFSTYGIASKLWNKKAGFIAVLFLAITPIFIGQFKEYMLDGPLIAWLALTIYLLIKTENYSKSSYNLLLGLALGLGMLLKWTYIAFVIFPIIYYFILMLKESIKNKETRNIYNFFFVIITSMAVGFQWYYVHRSAIMRDFKVNGLGDSDPVSLSSIWTWLFYVIESFDFYFLLFLGLFFGLLFILFIFKKQLRDYFLLGSLLTPYLIFVLLPNKDMRYFIPALLFVILICASSLIKLHWKYEKIIIYLLIIMGLFYQLNILINFKIKPITISVSRPNPEKRIPALSLGVYRNNYYTTSLPVKENWQIQDMVTKIKNGATKDQAEIRVVLLGQKDFPSPQDWRFNYFDIVYFGRKQSPYIDANESESDISNSDFAIVHYWSENKYQDVGKEIGHYILPDSSQVTIYDLKNN